MQALYNSHGDKCVSENMTADFETKITESTVHFPDSREFNAHIEEIFGKKHSKVRLLSTRGFTVGGEIYVKKGMRWGLDNLIRHEFGHLFGFHHTWKFTLINPLWLLRWVDKPKIKILRSNQ